MDEHSPIICNTLRQLGYTIKYQVMDAHIYGNLPQPRSRIYIVAFRDDDACKSFVFPEPIDLTIGINDIVHCNEKKNKTHYYSNDSKVVSEYGNQITDRRYIYRISDKGLIRVRNHFCPTLTANMGYYPDRIPIVCDDFGIRKLTLQECLDFQGFPVDFKFPKTITMNYAYRQIGNSVCVPVIRRIAEKIRDAIA
jgi:DNA (cytosine-5)-methyltransferase 1